MMDETGGGGSRNNNDNNEKSGRTGARWRSRAVPLNEKKINQKKNARVRNLAATVGKNNYARGASAV